MHNAILSFFWNHFDFFIRFGYCRLGFVSKLLNKLLFWKLYSSDFEKLDKIFEDSLFLLDKNNVPIKDKTILEIGPGNSYIIAYNFLMHGAKKVILVDKFPRTIKTKRQKEYFKREIEYVSKKYGQKPFFVNNGEIDGEYIEFINKDLTETDIKNGDLIFTNSVLEHVKNIKENIAFMSKILNMGGYMYHSIDLRDHYNFNKPFLFYKYSDRVWNNLLTKGGISYTNRLRYDDFVQLFKNMGFKVIYEKKQKENLADTKLCSEFKKKNKGDLEITFLSVLLQKSTDGVQNPQIIKKHERENIAGEYEELYGAEKKTDYQEMYYSVVKQNENSEIIQKWRTKPYEIIEYINNLPKDIKGLELGSGRGFLTRYLKEQGFKEVIGSDFNEYNIQLAKKLIDVSLKHIDALDINFRDASFDLIISVELIEHLPDVSKHIKEVKRVLKPGGLYCFSTPNVYMEKLYNFIKNQKPDGVHISLQSFGGISKLLKETGFEVKFIKMRQFRESHISKMGKLGKLSNFIPICYFLKIFQPTIYCVARLKTDKL